MNKTDVYNQTGEKVGQIELPNEIFSVKINQDLLRQVAISQMSNRRRVIAHTKDRSEVRGGGRKPWRQKGTGRARHGSIRSPLWIGGGVTFGPTKERNFKKQIPKKMKRKALFMVLSGKNRDNELVVLDELVIEKPKTKLMAKILNVVFDKILKTKKSSILFVLPGSKSDLLRAARNIAKAGTIRADSLNALELLQCKYLLMPKEAIKVIEKTYLKENPKSQIPKNK